LSFAYCILYEHKIAPFKHSKQMRKDVFAGIGLGLLVGTIIGLSIAQVTGIILAALTSILAAFFGFKENKDAGNGNQIIIGTFGFTCLLAIVLGVYLRTHNAFSPSLPQEIQVYKNANFSNDEIKKIILFKELGIVPQGYTFSKEAKEAGKATQSVLMAGEGSLPLLCESITEESTLAEIKKAYDDSGGKYQDMEHELSAIISDTTELKKTLMYLSSLLCKPKE
jgi:hypothetical protein